MFERFHKYYTKVISEKKEAVSEEEKKELELKEKSRKISIKEAATASAGVSFGDNYIGPYLIAINATLFQIAAFNSLIGLLAPIAQLFTSKLIEKKNRKSIVIKFVFWQILVWLPIIVSVFLFLNGFKFVPLLIIGLWAVYAFLGNLAAPAGNSWIGDLVPEEKRGRYFALRNVISGFIALITVLIASLFLDYSKRINLLFYCFAFLFLVSMILRFVSLSYTKKLYEPKLVLPEGYYFTFWQFLKRMKSNNFGRFTIYRSLFALSVNIAGPFFAVYALRQLGFSYFQFTLALIIVPTLIQIIAWPFWGKFSDKYGNLETLKIAGFLASLFPLLWLASGSFPYIVLVPMVLNGIAWSGMNLATTNFIFDNVSPKRRSLCFAYFSVIAGIGVSIGAGLGGYLSRLPLNLAINVFLFLFLISGFLRLITIFALGKRVKEVRPVAIRRPLYQYLQLLFRPFFRKGN